jgi:hypothetical protein
VVLEAAVFAYVANRLNPIPPPLRRYVAQIKERARRVHEIRDRERQLYTERLTAEQALNEAHRDYREVQRKWLALEAVARRVRGLREGRLPGQREVPGLRELEWQLEQQARDLGVAPAEALRRATP